MKSTEHFKNTIKSHLEQRAENDALFAVSFGKTNKNIDDCITYIFNTVKKSGCHGFTDDEVYSMAVHYYDEDNMGNKILWSLMASISKTIKRLESKSSCLSEFSR